MTKSITAVDRTLWALADNLGTNRDFVDNTGALPASTYHLKYDSFGNVTGGLTSISRYLYTGQEYDADTGLYYYNARWYDAKIGRFLSQDPLGFAAGDLNLSRYVNNGVVNATDPSGLAEFNWARDRELDELMRRAKARGDDVAYRMLLNARRRLHGAWDELDTGPNDPYAGDDWTGLNPDEVIRKHLRFVETAHDAAENYVEGVRQIPGYGDAIDLVDLAKDPTDAQKWSRFCPGPGDVLNRFRNLRRANRFADNVDNLENPLKAAMDRGMKVIRGEDAPDQMVEILKKLGRPMSRERIREIIHEAKRRMNLRGAEGLIFDRSGGMWDSRTGEYIGKIWENM